jgi:hypothetical protein
VSVFLSRSDFARDDHSPEEQEETNREQEVYISGRVIGERQHCPDCDERNRADDPYVHFIFVDGKISRPYIIAIAVM